MENSPIDIDEDMLEGDFEVVDECTGEDEPVSQSMETENPTDDSIQCEPVAESTEVEEVEQEKQVEDTEAKTDDGSTMMPVEENVPVDPSEPDFTADISLDNIETIPDEPVADAATQETSDVILVEEEPEKVTASENVDSTNETDSIVEVTPPVPLPAWYEDKLNAKSNIVTERLSKLSRVLELSYPVYKPWLEHNKMAVYHVDPPRCCPLDRPHTNRWKFSCSRKAVEESTNEEEDSAQGTVNKKLKTVWLLSPTGGSGVNTDNASQYPPFVMRVVKVFEEFIQSVDEIEIVEVQPTEGENSSTLPEEEKSELTDKPAASDEQNEDKNESTKEVDSSVEVKPVDEILTTVADNETGNSNDSGHRWLSLLVRSNSKDELMVFATGSRISEEIMQKLKQTFETGAGKDCNVKSLYCKSVLAKNENSMSNITFLSGTEALDETVGGLKIQLAPKTNFWCNASGVEQLGTTVGDMLAPLTKMTVIDVGCGLGLIGLMVAPKCKKLIGLDAPCEVEEAEMTSELNKVENASFIMGQSNEVMSKVTTMVKGCRSAAIINGNTKFGRDISVMAALRKIPSLRRIVMITTLTKQSVRAILELSRPADADIGNPFVPLRAVLVDTLPTGPYFEVVIRMERLNLQKINEPWFWNHIKFRADLIPKDQQQKHQDDKATAQAKNQDAKTPNSQSGKQNAANAIRRANNRANKRNKMKKQQKFAAQSFVHGAVTGVVRNPMIKNPMVKNPFVNLVKNPMAVFAKMGQSQQKGKNVMPAQGQQNMAKKSPNKMNVPQASKPMTDSPASPDQNSAKNQRFKPMNTPNLKKSPGAKFQQQQPGKGNQKFTPGQKRKRQWAPNEMPRQLVGIVGGNPQGPMEKKIRGNRNDMRGRMIDHQVPNLMQQVQNQQTLLNIAQQGLAAQGGMLDVNAAKQLQNMLSIVIDQTNKLQNQLPRSVWDRIAPPNTMQPEEQNLPRNSSASRERFVQNMGLQDIVITTPNREFDTTPLVPPPALMNQNQRSFVDRSKIMPAGMSARETHDNQQFRPRGISACLQGPQFGKNRQQSPSENPLMDITARPLSPKRPMLAPTRLLSPPRWEASSSFSQQENRRQPSPPPVHRQLSPPRRLMSPPQNNPFSDIFHRRPNSSQSRQNSDMDRRELSPPKSSRNLSPPRFQNNWEPNRGNQNWNQQPIQQEKQQNWNQRQMQQDRPVDRNVEQQRWSNDGSQISQNWNNDRYRQNTNPNEKDDMWMRGGGDRSGMDRQWTGSNTGQQGSNGNNWNNRGNGNYGQSNNRGDNWKNNANEKDWLDLPDDAKDPWGDEAPKNPSRWQQPEKPSNSNWARGDDQNWSNKSSTNNWQNKPSTNMNTNNQFWQKNQNEGQRWQPQNNSKKQTSSDGFWQPSNFGGNNWNQQNYSGPSQQHRQNTFGFSNFKDRR